jgi:hypothetical protein
MLIATLWSNTIPKLPNSSGYALKNSYAARCTAAMVSHNTKLVHTKYESVAKPISINKIIQRVELRRLAKTHRANLLKKSKGYMQNKILKSSQDQKPDMEKTDYDEAVDEFLSSIKKNRRRG